MGCYSNKDGIEHGVTGKEREMRERVIYRTHEKIRSGETTESRERKLVENEDNLFQEKNGMERKGEGMAELG